MAEMKHTEVILALNRYTSSVPVSSDR